MTDLTPVFDTEVMAEAHVNRLAGHAYDPRYRIAWRDVPDWTSEKEN